MTSQRKRTIAVAAALLMSVSAASAATVTFTLNRTFGPTNVGDAAGSTQYEAGTVTKAAAVVGNYFITRRVTSVPSQLFNTGSTTVTLFFAPKAGTTGAPENLTMEGAHDFSSGAFKGSVSAASGPFSFARGGDANYTMPSSGVMTLVIEFAGSRPLTIP